MHECKSSDELLGDILPSEIDFELLEILEFYEPYGQKNPRPVFRIENAVVKNERLIGRDQNHLKLILQRIIKRLKHSFLTSQGTLEWVKWWISSFVYLKIHFAGLLHRSF